MTPKLNSNKELVDYSVNDCFDFLTKAEAIKFFLEQNSTALKENKMIVLYGDWGSGKTSLMRHIEKNIDPIIYKPIFFQAWEHEKDENLALSLCDALIDCLDDKASVIVKSFMKKALLTLKGFTNGITFKSSHLLQKFGLEFEFSGEKFNEVFDKALEKESEPSFYFRNKEFKESFIAIEKEILKKHNATKLLIFVDDLDRCEPDNVLNLITALKLFFTYGEQSIFFCGVDKEAVTKAVKAKYRDIIKSEEYMEKVFDVAFNMPKTFSLLKMLNSTFPGETTFSNENTLINASVIEDFFRSVRFTNPRHLKKVINKYEILKSFKVLSTIPENIRQLIPNIIDGEGNGNIFETIYCLFFIILYEFYFDDFVELEGYEEKMLKFIEPYYAFHQTSNSNNDYTSIANNLRNRYTIVDHDKITLYSLLNTNLNENRTSYSFIKLLLLFSHTNIKYLTPLSDQSINEYSRSFSDSDFLTLYCKFLIRYKKDIIEKATDYPIWNLFEMVKYLL